MVNEVLNKSLKLMFTSDMYDENKAIQVINKFYSNSKLPIPKFVITISSPFSFDYALKYTQAFLNEIDGKTHWKGFEEKNWLFTSNKIKTNPPMRISSKKVWENVCDEIWLQIKKQIQNLDVIPTSFGLDVNGQIWRENKFASYADSRNIPNYVNTIRNEINVSVSNKSLTNVYINAFSSPELANVGVLNMYCMENICFISRAPIFIRLNDREQLDCKTDYALYWNDGYGKYYVEGVRIADYLFQRAFIQKILTPEELMAIENVEVKSVLIKEYGYDFIKTHLKNLKVLHQTTVLSKITNRPTNYEVFEYDFQRGVRIRVVRVECHTTHHLTFLGVPRIKQTETCLGAIGWTFGMEEEDYKLAQES